MDRRGVEIRLDGEALTFYEKDERIATVPIAPLERIYVCGDTLVRAGLLAKLGERGVGVVFLSGRRFVPSLFLPKPHNDASRRIKQYELSSSNVFKMRFSREIVSRKIRAQRDCLLSLKTEHSECENELTELSDIVLFGGIARIGRFCGKALFFRCCSCSSEGAVFFRSKSSAAAGSL